MTQKQQREFVARVKKVRAAIPMSLDDFRKELGIGIQTLFRWEHGRVLPQARIIRQVRPIVEALAKKYKVAA